MPNAELAAFIEGELERNPLLERADDAPARTRRARPPTRRRAADAVEPGDWASDSLETDPGGARRKSRHRNRQRLRSRPRRDAAGARAAGRRQGPLGDLLDGGGGRGGGEDGAPDLEAYVAEPVTLREHLTRQATIVLDEPVDRMIGAR